MGLQKGAALIGSGNHSLRSTFRGNAPSSVCPLSAEESDATDQGAGAEHCENDPMFVLLYIDSGYISFALCG